MVKARDLKIGNAADDIKKTNFNKLFMVESLDGPQDVTLQIDTSVIVASKKIQHNAKRSECIAQFCTCTSRNMMAQSLISLNFLNS